MHRLLARSRLPLAFRSNALKSFSTLSAHGDAHKDTLLKLAKFESKLLSTKEVLTTTKRMDETLVKVFAHVTGLVERYKQAPSTLTPETESELSKVISDCDALLQAYSPEAMELERTRKRKSIEECFTLLTRVRDLLHPSLQGQLDLDASEQLLESYYGNPDMMGSVEEERLGRIIKDFSALHAHLINARKELAEECRTKMIRVRAELEARGLFDAKMRQGFERIEEELAKKAGANDTALRQVIDEFNLFAKEFKLEF